MIKTLATLPLTIVCCFLSAIKMSVMRRVCCRCCCCCRVQVCTLYIAYNVYVKSIPPLRPLHFSYTNRMFLIYTQTHIYTHTYTMCVAQFSVHHREMLCSHFISDLWATMHWGILYKFRHRAWSKVREVYEQWGAIHNGARVHTSTHIHSITSKNKPKST